MVRVVMGLADWLKETFGPWGIVIVISIFVLVFVGMIVLLALWKRTSQGKEETLLWAVLNNKTRLLKKLLDQGVNPNAKTPEGWTPLMLAASNGNKVATELLLAKGASVTILDYQKKSASDHALENGHTDLARLLVRDH